MDLELGPERPLLVITGPNAGGKTIALKTLAVHALMAQVGCHVPADEGSRLPVFDDVFAIIGDDQSVAENLSTFSAFVKQAREILDAADERSLVLLDELGAGTDPDEGAALAQAILEELAERGALVIATTHLEPLKAFASTHPRARNASVEFDTATLAPTFRLRYDQPGQSYALTIAARLGLGAELIARANAHRSEHAARLSELLATLDAHARSELERTREIERIDAETAARLAKARQTEASAESRAQAIVARARAEATALVSEIRRALAAEWDKLKRPDRSRRSLDESRRRVRDAAAKVETATPEEPAVEMAALAPGATVAAEHLGVRGELVEIAGSSATVRSGSVTVRVPVSALRPAAAAPERRPRQGGVRRLREARCMARSGEWAGTGSRDGRLVDRMHRSAPSDPSSCCSARRPTRRAIGSSSISTTRFSRVWPACGWFMARAPARSERPSATCWPVIRWSSRSGTVSPRKAARARPWPRSRSADGPVSAVAARRHPRRRRHRRPRRPLREPEEGRHRLEGPLPVPCREDALLHGQPAQGHLPLLRLRGRAATRSAS